MSDVLDPDQVTVERKLRVRMSKDPADIDRVRHLSRAALAESRYSDIPFDSDKRDQFVRRVYEHPDRCALFVAELGDEPIGLINCGAGELMIGSRDKLVTIYGFYVAQKIRPSALGGRTALRLLAAAVEWSRAIHAREIMISVTSGIDVERTDRFLRRANFGVIGANYALDLRPPGGRA